MVLVARASALNNVCRTAPWEIVRWPRIEQRNFGLPRVFVLQVAHRPVILDPRYEALWLANRWEIVPPAEDVGRMTGGNGYCKLQRPFLCVVCNRIMLDDAMIGAELHAIRRIAHHCANWPKRRQHFAAIALYEADALS